jgi:hypothetical protein
MWVIDDTCSFSKKLKKYLTSIRDRFCNPKEYRLFKIEAEKYNDAVSAQPYGSIDLYKEVYKYTSKYLDSFQVTNFSTALRESSLLNNKYI